MKTLVVYWSKTGFVKKYAEWIAEKLEADLISGKEIKLDKLKEYDQFVFGGSLYAVGINGSDFMKKNLKEIADKRIAIFATGASPARTEIIAEIRSENFSSEEQQYFKFFYLRGGFNFENLGFKDMILMKMMKWQLKRKKKKGEELSEDEAGMLAAFDQPVDFTDRKNIKEIVDYFDNSNTNYG